MGDKVAILGTVPNSRNRVPFDDQSWDIWCCSGGNSQANAPKRITEWFELHALVDLHSEEHVSWYGPYIEWINKQTFPVWMQEKNTDIPRANVFPWKALTEEFGPNPKKGKLNWFTSSPAWMLGWAILRGYKQIGIFGIDMAAAQEHYTGQKAGFHRWFEICAERGIKITVPLESSLAFSYPLYGYAEASRLGRHLVSRETEMSARLNFLRNQQALLNRDICHLEGAFEQIVFDRRTYTSSLDDAEIDGAGMGLPIYDESQLSPVSQELLNQNRAFPSSPVAAPVAASVPGQESMVARKYLPTIADFPDNPDAALIARVPASSATVPASSLNGSEPMKVKRVSKPRPVLLQENAQLKE